MMDDNAEVSAAIAGADDVEVDEGHDYDTKGTPLVDPEDPEDPERYMKGKVGGKVMEDSGEKEKKNYKKNVGADEKHLKDLEKDIEYDKDHEKLEEEDLNESYLPKGRDIRTEARKQTYAKLVEKWCK